MERKEIIEKTAAIIEAYRECAFNAVDEIMLQAFEEVGELLTGEKCEVDKGKVAGMYASLFNEIAAHYADESLDTWILGDRQSELQLSFLDLNSLNVASFRKKFPNAYQKWSPEDDAELVQMYDSGMPWEDMSLKFGRNRNALMIRLKHLGYDIPGVRQRY